MSTVQTIDFSVDLLRAILWQYNDAAKLQALVQNKQNSMDKNHTQFWTNWITNVFNLKTANEFGLAVWSIILDLPLFVSEAPNLNKPTFGFSILNKNFSFGNFSTATGGASSLPLEIKRLALRLRYYQFTLGGCVPEVNRMLADVFEDYGKVYLLDGLNMTQTYVFTFAPSSSLRFMLDNLDVLPKPAGVGSSYLVLGSRLFGFSALRENFFNSNLRKP